MNISFQKLNKVQEINDVITAQIRQFLLLWQVIASETPLVYLSIFTHTITCKLIIFSII